MKSTCSVSRADTGQIQTAAITCLPKNGGGQRMSDQTKLWSVNHSSDGEG